MAATGTGPRLAGDGEETFDEDTGPPFGSGRRGAGRPMQVGRGPGARELQDGGGLCSPGIWLPQDRRYAPAPLLVEVRELLLAAIRTLGEGGPKRVLASMAAGRTVASPFGPALIARLRAAVAALVVSHNGECAARAGDLPQPINMRLFGALLKSASDPDADAIADFAGGVRLGVGTRMPRIPAVYPRKVRWSLPEQGHPELWEEVNCEVPILLKNYRSARDLTEEVEKDLEEQCARGLSEKLSEAEARERFGAGFVVASLGALVKRTEADGTRVIRVLFDGTHDVDLNTRIQVRDQEIPPGPLDLKRLLRAQSEGGAPAFGLVADVSDAHRAIAIVPGDWHLLGCRARENGSLYFHHRGTFGVSSASYWWGRVASAFLRLTHYVVRHSAVLWATVLADDYKFEVSGGNFVETLLLPILLGEIVGIPWSWTKLRGGTEFTWVGFELQLKEFSLGLSASRAAWLIGWYESLLRDKAVQIREFLAGLGRAAYACGALEFDRPFLAPLCTFGSLHPLDSTRALPTYVLVVVQFLRDRLTVRRVQHCGQKLGEPLEALRVDAKAEGETATLGGWRPTRNERGEIDPSRSPWFFVALNDRVAPWAYEKERQPFRVAASLEALAALVAVVTLGPPPGRGRSRGSVLLPLCTDNRGNTHALTRLMSTKYPLCLWVMELAATLEERGLLLDAAWAPREWNAEADAITNQDFGKFDKTLRVNFKFSDHKWLVFDALFAAGAKFYREATALRVDRPPPVKRTRRGGIKAKRASLKERDPW